MPTITKDNPEVAVKALLAERSLLEDRLKDVEEALTVLKKLSGKPIGPGAALASKANWSSASREAVSRRMKKYWAERKKKERQRSARRRAKPSPTSLLGGVGDGASVPAQPQES